MIVKEISYSESQKISSGKYETTLISFSAKIEPHELQSPEDASTELVSFVKSRIFDEVKKSREKKVFLP